MDIGVTTSEQWEEVVVSGKGLWRRHDTGGNVASEMYKIEIAWGQEYWSGLPFPSPGDLPGPGIEPTSLALVDGFFTTESPGKPTLSAIFALINFCNCQ